VCDHESPTVRRPWSTGGCCAMLKNIWFEVRCLMFRGLSLLFSSGCPFNNICYCVGSVVSILRLIPTCGIRLKCDGTDESI